MNPAYPEISWHVIGFWWCAACFVLGCWAGWLLWRHSDMQARQLEIQNLKAKKDFEEREEIFAANQQTIDSFEDPNS